MDTMTKAGGDMASFGQDHAQAFMKSGQIWSSGCHALGQTIAAATQAHFEHMTETLKAMSGVKSFKEASEMQTKLVRTSIENAVATTGKITEATMTLFEESMAPVTASITSAAEKFTIRPN